VVNLLLDKKADVEAKDDCGLNPLINGTVHFKIIYSIISYLLISS
jgi:hypothetical protein